jgi:hypothetical protein
LFITRASDPSAIGLPSTPNEKNECCYDAIL